MKIVLALTLFALYLGFVEVSIMAHKNSVGSWGNICKHNAICNDGLICIYDNHGYPDMNRRSICLDPKTMVITGK